MIPYAQMASAMEAVQGGALMFFNEAMGITAAVLALADIVIYILAIYGRDYLFRRLPKEKWTVPNRATWLILAGIGILIAISYKETGATDTVWLPMAYAFGFSTVALLSLKHGEGGHTILDLICLVGAGLAALVWWKYDSPGLPLTIGLLMETFAATPTIKKAWVEPSKESRLAWTLSFLASVANIFALTWETSTFWIILLPVWILILNGLITAPLYLKNR
ncbi:MAG: hypothetical protein AAB605_01155 [Patescibacteria group bacterium]